jgi:hypothetical protein
VFPNQYYCLSGTFSSLNHYSPRLFTASSSAFFPLHNPLGAFHSAPFLFRIKNLKNQEFKKLKN